MRIERFEHIEAWQLARESTHKVYSLTKKARFARDFGLKGQIQDAPALPFEVSSRHTSGGLALPFTHKSVVQSYPPLSANPSHISCNRKYPCHIS